MEKKINNLEEENSNSEIEIELRKNDISDDIIKSITKRGFEKLTDIQKKVIPIIMEGKDVVGKSATGTGKTASFLIPIIDKIRKMDKRSRNPKSIIITPTRELALQIKEEADKLSSYKLKTVAIYGGGGKKTVKSQYFLFKKGIDIIVGTPGRIIDHLERRNFDTSEIKLVVLDEADNMINAGFIDSIKMIMKQIEKNNCQKMLFSATLSQDVDNFKREYLNNPDIVEAEIIKNDGENIEQLYVYVNNFREKKRKIIELLSEIKKNTEDYRIIIFVNTKEQSVRLFEKISEEFDSKAKFVNSDLSQSAREEIMKKFKDGKISILVTTNVYARGIHVDGITHVINYDLPQDNEFYVHRIGRTGRAGEKGKSITIISGYLEKKKLLGICRENKFKISEKTTNVSRSGMNNERVDRR